MPVLVDVEYIFFLAEGGRTNVSFVATFDVGVQADVTESTMISYASSDANVATVDASSGRLIVTGAGPGHGTTSIPLTIPVTNSRPL